MHGVSFVYMNGLGEYISEYIIRKLGMCILFSLHSRKGLLQIKCIYMPAFQKVSGCKLCN